MSDDIQPIPYPPQPTGPPRDPGTPAIDPVKDLAYWENQTEMHQAFAVVSKALELVCAKYNEIPQTWFSEAKKKLLEP